MSTFNANDARFLVGQKNKITCDLILKEIERLATEGIQEIEIGQILDEFMIESFLDLGFECYLINRQGVYKYRISWYLEEN